MLKLFILTIIMLLSGASIVRILYRMVQPDGAIDIIFDWQKKMAPLYASTNKYKQMLEKVLGGCAECMAFWFMLLWAIVYVGISKLYLGMWVTDVVPFLVGKIIIAIVAFISFWAIGATLGAYFITYNSKK